MNHIQKELRWSFVSAIDARHVFRGIKAGLDQSRKYGACAPRPDEVIYLDPKQITGHVSTSLARKVRRQVGLKRAVIVGGDWDLEVRKVAFRDTDLFKSCKLRFLLGVPWMDTPIYRQQYDEIKKGVNKEFKTLEELRVRYEKLDGVFAQVQSEQALSASPNHLIRINIGRTGQVSWGPDGRHRLAIALVANIASIPARIGFVHPEGLRFLTELRSTKEAFEGLARRV